MRRGGWKFLIGAVVISVVFTFIVKDTFAADYIPEPVLIEVTPLNPPVTEEVIVDLTASPQEGFAPLEVTFTCTAEAVIHYADERWALPPQGSVTRTEPLYETVTANITEQPAD